MDCSLFIRLSLLKICLGVASPAISEEDLAFELVSIVYLFVE